MIKTRMQVTGSGGKKPYNTIPEAAVDIMKNEGPTAFFKGAAARVFRSSPQFAVTLMCYELLHNLVHQNQSEPQQMRQLVKKIIKMHSVQSCWCESG